MRIIINNIDYDVSSETTLEKVPSVIHLESTSGIAFAVNNTVVSRQEWAVFALKADDRVLVIKAIQGG
jgi:sulfur carrier protein